jgi:hypothetical protein
VLPEVEWVVDGLGSEFWGGGRDDGGASVEDSPRRRRLNIECLRGCEEGSAVVRASLAIGEGDEVGRCASAAGDVAVVDESAWDCVGMVP